MRGSCSLAVQGSLNFEICQGKSAKETKRRVRGRGLHNAQREAEDEEVAGAVHVGKLQLRDAHSSDDAWLYGSRTFSNFNWLKRSKSHQK